MCNGAQLISFLVYMVWSPFTNAIVKSLKRKPEIQVEESEYFLRRHGVCSHSITNKSIFYENTYFCAESEFLTHIVCTLHITTKRNKQNNILFINWNGTYTVNFFPVCVSKRKRRRKTRRAWINGIRIISSSFSILSIKHIHIPRQVSIKIIF